MTRLTLTLTLLCIILTLITAKKIKFENCGPSTIDYVDIDPCDSEPCKFKHGQVAHIEGQGVSNSDSSTATIKAIVMLDDVPVEVPDIDPDACKIVDCPIVKGKSYKIVYDFTIEDFFPDVITNLTVTVTGDKGEEDIILCIKTQVGVEN